MHWHKYVHPVLPPVGQTPTSSPHIHKSSLVLFRQSSGGPEINPSLWTLILSHESHEYEHLPHNKANTDTVWYPLPGLFIFHSLKPTLGPNVHNQNHVQIDKWWQNGGVILGQRRGVISANVGWIDFFHVHMYTLNLWWMSTSQMWAHERWGFPFPRGH